MSKNRPTYGWLWPVLLMVAWCGCHGSQRFRPENLRDPAAIRRQLDGLRDPEQRTELQRQLERLEFSRARQVDTAYAWRHFLEQFPGSPLALDARERLEEIEYRQAVAANDEQAFGAFLRAWPRGRRADEARRQLARLECRRLMKSSDPGQLTHQVRRQLPCRRQLRERLARIRFSQALESGSLVQLHDFLLAWGDAPQGQRAREILAAKQVPELCRAAEFERCRELLKYYGLGGSAWSKLLDQAERDWRLTGWSEAQLDYCRQAGRCPGGRGGSLRRWLSPLAEASARLREPASPEPDEESELPQDARLRWLLADRLADRADMQAADLLLKLFEDDYLEVRRRAWLGLRRLAGNLGPARSLAWLAAKQRRLRSLAASGRLLLRRALLKQLTGDLAAALQMVQRFIGEGEGTDPLAYAMGVELAGQLGQPRQVAIMARNFTAAAQEFFSQRLQALPAGGLELGESGGRTLRQLYGLHRLWRQVLASFKSRVQSDFRVELGDWLARSRAGAEKLRGWLKQARRRWMTSHPGWTASSRPEPAPAAPERYRQDLLQAAWLPRAWSAPTLDWLQCCHPDSRLRRRARLVAVQARLLEDSGLLLALWRLLPAPLAADSAAEEAAGGGATR